jgi:hypothetical protein
MQAEASKRKHRRLGRVAFWLGAGLLVVAAIRSISVTDTNQTGPVDEVDDQVSIRTIRVKTVDIHPANPNQPKAERGDLDLKAGETISVALQELPTERPLVLNLLLPAALLSADALPARIVALDGSRELKLSDALVANDRDEVRVQIESGWLSPGRYRIEIETTEQSPLALRRYLLEVR